MKTCYFCSSKLNQLNNHDWCYQCRWPVRHVYKEEHPDELNVVYYHVVLPTNGREYCVYQYADGNGFQIIQEECYGGSNVYSSKSKCTINPTNAVEKIKTYLTFS